MCDSIFSFGQRGSHFFQCPSRRSFYSVPKKLRNLVDANVMSYIWHVTLGAANSFVVAYRGRDGKDHIRLEGIPEALTNWLLERDNRDRYIRDVKSIRVTLGPHNDSWYATDRSSWLWMNLPSDLLSALQSRTRNGQWIDKPRLVVLGADSDFVLITENSSAVWELKGYQTLRKMLEFSRSQAEGIASIHNMTLHPYRYQCFIAQSKNGTVLSGNLPPSSVSNMNLMKTTVQQDTEVAARQLRTTPRPDRQPSRTENLTRQATLHREWSNQSQEIRREASQYKMQIKLTLSLTASIGKLLG